MKAKEKAIELIDNYLGYIGFEYYQNRHYSVREMELAKLCAIVCVDEIIKVFPSTEYMEDLKKHIPNRETGFWQEVKQEINNL